VDEAKPRNAIIHIKSVGTTRASTGCVHACANATGLLCACTNTAGMEDGCTAQNTASTSSASPTAPGVTPPATTTPSPTAADSQSPDVCASHNAIRNSATNYCDCIPGHVDQAKPSNTRVHVNAVGAMNRHTNCAHTCVSGANLSSVCACLGDPTYSGCT
jgi:hypothetical protein